MSTILFHPRQTRKVYHIGRFNVVYWVHQVFRVLQQTPSPRCPSRDWSSPGLCPGSPTSPTTLPSWSTAILSQLCDHCCGPSLVGSTEGLASERSAPYFDGLTPRSPPVGAALLHQLCVLRSLPLVGFLDALFPRDGEFQEEDVLWGYGEQHHVRPQCWDSNFSLELQFSQSCAVESRPEEEVLKLLLASDQLWWKQRLAPPRLTLNLLLEHSPPVLPLALFKRGFVLLPCLDILFHQGMFPQMFFLIERLINKHKEKETRVYKTQTNLYTFSPPPALRQSGWLFGYMKKRILLFLQKTEYISIYSTCVCVCVCVVYVCVCVNPLKIFCFHLVNVYKTAVWHPSLCNGFEKKLDRGQTEKWRVAKNRWDNRAIYNCKNTPRVWWTPHFPSLQYK